MAYDIVCQATIRKVCMMSYKVCTYGVVCSNIVCISGPAVSLRNVFLVGLNIVGTCSDIVG